MKIPETIVSPKLRPALRILGFKKFMDMCFLFKNKVVRFQKPSIIEWRIICLKIRKLRMRGVRIDELAKRFDLAPEIVAQAVNDGRKYL